MLSIVWIASIYESIYGNRGLMSKQYIFEYGEEWVQTVNYKA